MAALPAQDLGFHVGVSPTTTAPQARALVWRGCPRPRDRAVGALVRVIVPQAREGEGHGFSRADNRSFLTVIPPSALAEARDLGFHVGVSPTTTAPQARAPVWRPRPRPRDRAADA
jgi:hypothetical protein